MLRALILPILLLATPALAANSTVVATAITNLKSLKPGDPLTLAVTLTTEPRWHIYWKNPGDSGTPTRFKLELPEGFTASAPEVPLPVEFKQAGNLVAYGYTGSATFLFQITTPKNFSAQTADVTITANFLCCNEDKCVPGKQKLTISIPMAEASTENPAATDVLKSAKAVIPTDAPMHAAVAPAKPAALVTTKSPLSLNLHWDKPVKDVQAFPLTPDTVELSKPVVKHENPNTSITAYVRLLNANTPAPEKIDFLITYTDDAGTRHGFYTAVELAAPSKSK
jgi:thiol:disulfide interchange protein DsbD